MNDTFTEILELTFAIFEDTYGLDLDDAFTQARALYPALQNYARAWDAESFHAHLKVARANTDGPLTRWREIGEAEQAQIAVILNRNEVAA